MKKITFLAVFILAVFISTDASAQQRGWTEKSNAELQGFFGAKVLPPMPDTPQGRLLITREALQFHLNRVNSELSSVPATSTPATSTSKGILAVMLAPYPTGGSAFAATRTPVYGIDFYASRTPMVVDVIRLKVSVKATSSAPEENPSVLVKNIVVTTGASQKTFPVTPTTFVKDGTTYYAVLSNLGINVPMAGGPVKTVISFDANPIDFERIVQVGIYTTTGIVAIDANKIPSYYTLPEVRTFAFRKFIVPVVPPKVGLGNFFKNYVDNVVAQVAYMFGR